MKSKLTTKESKWRADAEMVSDALMVADSFLCVRVTVWNKIPCTLLVVQCSSSVSVLFLYAATKDSGVDWNLWTANDEKLLANARTHAAAMFYLKSVILALIL